MLGYMLVVATLVIVFYLECRINESNEEIDKLRDEIEKLKNEKNTQKD